MSNAVNCPLSTVNLIVAVDEDWGIGYQGDLLVKISEDLKYFKKKTTGSIVVMGRKTFESLPNKKILPKRVNVILTSDKDYIVPDAMVCHSVEEVLEIVQRNMSLPNLRLQTFIIGGEQIYKAFLPYCTKAYITKIFHKFKADKYLPNFVETEDWSLTSESEVFTTDDGIKYQFLVYEKG